MRIKVDDSDWMEATKVKGPLFVASWNVALYEKGIHNIQVLQSFPAFSLCVNAIVSLLHYTFRYMPRTLLVDLGRLLRDFHWTGRD